MGIPPTRFRQYPHEFSGGMRQRIMIALALVLRPKLLVADEPTTSLDVIVEAQILAILADLRDNFGTALLLITHNLGIVAEACDRVAVMYAGEIVEEGAGARRLRRARASVHARAAPLDDLARDDGAALDPRRAAEPHRPAAGMPLPSALPGRDAACARRSTRSRQRLGRGGECSCWLHGPPTRSPRARRCRSSGRRSPSPRRREWRRPSHAAAHPAGHVSLVSVRGLKTYYSIRGSFRQRLVGREAGYVKAVDDVSFDLRRGEVLGLVGESGSGKTTLGRTLLGLVPATEGSVVFDGDEITGMSERELRALRRSMQIVFQDPHASLNPAMTIEQSVGHPLEIHKVGHADASTDSASPRRSRPSGSRRPSSSWTSTRPTSPAVRSSAR